MRKLLFILLVTVSACGGLEGVKQAADEKRPIKYCVNYNLQIDLCRDTLITYLCNDSLGINNFVQFFYKLNFHDSFGQRSFRLHEFDTYDLNDSIQVIEMFYYPEVSFIGYYYKGLPILSTQIDFPNKVFILQKMSGLSDIQLKALIYSCKNHFIDKYMLL